MQLNVAIVTEEFNYIIEKRRRKKEKEAAEDRIEEVCTREEGTGRNLQLYNFRGKIIDDVYSISQ